MKRISLFAFTSSTLLATACMPEVSPGAFPTQVFDAGVEEETSTELGGGRGAGDMNGTWLMVHEQSNCVALPGTELVDEALSVTFELVRFEQSGGRVHETREICALSLYPVLGFESTFPPVAARSTNPFEVVDSYVSGIDIGGSYSSGIEHQLFGVNLEDPLSDEMPTDATDPRVYDGDNDGNPGLTLIVGRDCEMYVAQRSSIRYRGLFATPNQIVGESSTLYAQVVLGSSSLLCSIPREVTANDPYGNFKLSRIDGRGGAVNFDDNGDGTISCDEVMVRQASLWDYRDPNSDLCGG